MGDRDHWLVDWVRASLQDLLQSDASITAQNDSDNEVCIEWTLPPGARSEIHRSVKIRFDQGVYSALSVARPESRVTMGARMRDLYDRQVEQAAACRNETVVVYVDSSITARTPTCPVAEPLGHGVVSSASR